MQSFTQKANALIKKRDFQDASFLAVNLLNKIILTQKIKWDETEATVEVSEQVQAET